MDDTVIDRLSRQGREIHGHLLRSVVELVSLTAVKATGAGDSLLREARPDPRMNTAFLMELDGKWVVCTAGHVASRIRERSSGERRLVAVDLGCAMHEGGGRRVRLDLRGLTIASAFDKVSGFDAAAIPLSEEHRSAVAATGSAPFPRTAWDCEHFDPDLFVLLGFPGGNDESYTEATAEGIKLNTRVYSPMLPVEAIRDTEGRSRIPLFRGRLLARSSVNEDGKALVLSSTEGMSGGPILGLRLRDADYDYRLTAMQTHEYPDGTIGGCFINHVVKAWRGQDPLA